MTAPDGLGDSIPADGGVHWATVEIKCRHHAHTNDPFLIRLSTFDGKQSLTEMGEKSTQEWVGDFDERAIAPTPAGDTQHFRLRLTCARPSCSYDLPLRLDSLDLLQSQLCIIWEERLPNRIIPNYAAWLDRQATR